MMATASAIGSLFCFSCGGISSLLYPMAPGHISFAGCVDFEVSCACMSPRDMDRTSEASSSSKTANKTGWKLLLILPYLGLCIPAIYARATPTLFGFPFFYWYQFLWVVLTSALLGFIYLKLKDPVE
jgi:hypothetical protein